MKLKLPFWLEKKLNCALHTIHCTAEFVVTDKNNKLCYNHKQFMHSLNENFLSFFYCALTEYTASPHYGFTAPHTSAITLFDITNLQVNAVSFNAFSCKGDGLNSNSGIIVGRGSPTIMPLTRSLVTPIIHGSGVNELWYGQQISVNGVTVIGNTSSLLIQRSFVNSSGADIVVSEFGLQSIQGNHILHAVDPITPNINIPMTRTLTIITSISITT